MVKYIEKETFEKIIADSTREDMVLITVIPIIILFCLLGVIAVAVVLIYSPILLLEFYIRKGYNKWKTKN